MNKKVMIWDLDYYYANDKSNCFNPDAMKISSYHKQMGDSINFVLNKNDINRPFDICYIIKENMFLKENPPFQFYTDSRVRWWGDAYKARVKWHMSDAMLACRPDYLLYPNKDTVVERAEHIRLFNNKAELLPITQEYKNTFKNKITIVTDTSMWGASKNDLSKALDMLTEVKNLSFLYPISYRKIISDKDIEEKFLNLKFTKKSILSFEEIKINRDNDFNNLIDLINKIRYKNPTITIPKMKVDIDYSQYKTREESIGLFEKIKRWIIIAKENKIHIFLDVPFIHETPFNHFFAAISYWTNSDNFYKGSWLNFITIKSKMNEYDWYRPQNWPINFRELLRQTYKDRDFVLAEWGQKKKEENNIPWKIWEEEFKLGV